MQYRAISRPAGLGLRRPITLVSQLITFSQLLKTPERNDAYGLRGCRGNLLPVFVALIGAAFVKRQLTEQHPWPHRPRRLPGKAAGLIMVLNIRGDHAPRAVPLAPRNAVRETRPT